MEEDRGIGSVTPQSKHFLTYSEVDGEKRLAVYLFFSFLLSKMKTESTAGVEFLSKKRCQGNETIMCLAQW